MAGHMAPFRAKSKSGGTGLRRAGDDAFKLTVDYLKQEALDPLKGLGRFLLWGTVGSLAIAVGILLLLVGILRLLQTQTGTALTGNWSWVPYFAVGVIGLAVVGVSAWRITAGPGKRKQPKTDPKVSAPTSLTTPTTPMTPHTSSTPLTSSTPAAAPAPAAAAAPAPAPAAAPPAAAPDKTLIGLGEPTAAVHTRITGSNDPLGKKEGSS
jgi:hypothetical protein